MKLYVVFHPSVFSLLMFNSFTHILQCIGQKKKKCRSNESPNWYHINQLLGSQLQYGRIEYIFWISYFKFFNSFLCFEKFVRNKWYYHDVENCGNMNVRHFRVFWFCEILSSIRTLARVTTNTKNFQSNERKNWIPQNFTLNLNWKNVNSVDNDS